eukprot:GHVR01107655.1.p1 GENE.GHVR01107655.1~~GHVR01107655.1.p1  ORF type:complete len:550 (+),score=197.73 GHVR01107655.1:203-1852(+)
MDGAAEDIMKTIGGGGGTPTGGGPTGAGALGDALMSIGNLPFIKDKEPGGDVEELTDVEKLRIDSSYVPTSYKLQGDALSSSREERQQFLRDQRAAGNRDINPYEAKYYDPEVAIQQQKLERATMINNEKHFAEQEELLHFNPLFGKGDVKKMSSKELAEISSGSGWSTDFDLLVAQTSQDEDNTPKSQVIKKDPSVCVSEVGVRYRGDKLFKINDMETYDICCEACDASIDCVAISYKHYQFKCYLLTSITGFVHDEDYTSGPLQLDKLVMTEDNNSGADKSACSVVTCYDCPLGYTHDPNTKDSSGCCPACVPARRGNVRGAVVGGGAPEKTDTDKPTEEVDEYSYEAAKLRVEKRMREECIKRRDRNSPKCRKVLQKESESSSDIWVDHLNEIVEDRHAEIDINNSNTETPYEIEDGVYVTSTYTVPQTTNIDDVDWEGIRAKSRIINLNNNDDDDDDVDDDGIEWSNRGGISDAYLKEHQEELSKYKLREQRRKEKEKQREDKLIEQNKIKLIEEREKAASDERKKEEQRNKVRLSLLQKKKKKR